MTPAKTRLVLRPERCDGCGRCERVCEKRAVRVGRGYLFVDWSACDGCGTCVDVCDRGAILRTEAAAARRRGLRAPHETAGPATERDPHAWSVPEAVAALSAMLALFVAEEVALSSAWVAGLRPAPAAMVRLLVLGAYYALQLALIAMLAARKGAGVARAFRLTGEGTPAGHKAASAAATLGMLVVTLALNAAWGKLASTIGWQPPARWSSDLTALFGGDALGLALTLAMAAALGPFVEEVVFRGVVLGALRSRWGDAVAIVGSALIFASFHFSWWSIVPATLLGLALAWLTVRRGSLWPAIALHCAYNAYAVLGAFWLTSRGGV